jgi:hypothetical protein
MNNIWDENTYKICEDIETADTKYLELSDQSTMLYNNMIKAINEYVNSTTELLAYSEMLMLNFDINTAQKTAQSVLKYNFPITINSNQVRNAINRRKSKGAETKE